MGRHECGRLALTLAGLARSGRQHYVASALVSPGVLGRALLWSSPSGMHLRHFADLPPHTIMSMPALSPTMTQGNIAKWLKKEGDQLSAGQVLAEVETDKATMDWEGQEDGYLAKIIAGDGAKDIAVGTPVAVLVEEESSVGAFEDYQVGGSAQSETADKPTPPKKEAQPPPPSLKAKSQEKATSSFPPYTTMCMPALSPTMTQGNIVSWTKKEGDTVAPGDLLCDVETDKATMAWEAQEEGFIAKILAPDGSKDIDLGTPVAILVEDKDSIAAFEGFTAADACAGGSGSAATVPQEPETVPQQQQQQQPPPPQKAKLAAEPATSGERVHASPYAKKLAAEAGISLLGITPTGPDNRIVAEDVQKAIKSGSAKASGSSEEPAAAAGAAAAASPVSEGGHTDTPNTNIRKVTARRLLESKQTVPHYYLTMECQMDALSRLREQINANAAASGVKVSVNDLIIKASALALRKVPTVNSSWNSEYIRQYNYVDISVAVQTPLGLMVPIVKDADKKGLAAISADVITLASKAKEGKLKPDEFTGGTFTVSNLGMFGIKQFNAIINPPQAAILAVGGFDKKVVTSKAGGFEQVTTMMATLSCDHRVVDGAAGAQWLQAFKSFIENPYTMLL